MIINPVVLIQALFLLVLLGVVKRYRIASAILFLSFFCSGVLMQQTILEIPVRPLVPPPPTAPPPNPIMISPLFILMITPSMALVNIVLFFQIMYLPIILWTSFLLVLAVLTSIVTGLVTDGKIDAVLAMLLYVIIIIGWTFSIIPLGMYVSTNMILTPIPLGPLVALNALPWFFSSKIEEQETIQ
jgi:hypothetical protein